MGTRSASRGFAPFFLPGLEALIHLPHVTTTHEAYGRLPVTGAQRPGVASRHFCMTLTQGPAIVCLCPCLSCSLPPASSPPGSWITHLHRYLSIKRKSSLKVGFICSDATVPSVLSRTVEFSSALTTAEVIWSVKVFHLALQKFWFSLTQKWGTSGPAKDVSLRLAGRGVTREPAPLCGLEATHLHPACAQAVLDQVIPSRPSPPLACRSRNGKGSCGVFR